MPPRTLIDRTLLALALAVLAASPVLAFLVPGYFSTTFAAEDGPVESGTALMLFAAGALLAARAPGFARAGRRGAAALTVLYAALFVFAAGEEISWGQRIFGWGTPEFFAANNYQKETNLHNLTIGGHRLGRTLFGSVLTTVLLLYLVVLPLLYGRVRLIRRLADGLAVPVPWPHHGLLAVGASVVVAAIDVPRNWEVYELVFALLAASIFLRPQNRAAEPDQKAPL
ncbi:hypothetical protein [Roseovarius salinarum]|jgi:hypothetical protein|uniref:hypothetical protein n=1 Tax=Roseovarius salinarum TaxID=1981892 RepID=UPI000C337719|nr:hypothetical protein [Roseovarius salinarum]